MMQELEIKPWTTKREAELVIHIYRAQTTVRDSTRPRLCIAMA